MDSRIREDYHVEGRGENRFLYEIDKLDRKMESRVVFPIETALYSYENYQKMPSDSGVMRRWYYFKRFVSGGESLVKFGFDDDNEVGVKEQQIRDTICSSGMMMGICDENGNKEMLCLTADGFKALAELFRISGTGFCEFSKKRNEYMADTYFRKRASFMDVSKAESIRDNVNANGITLMIRRNIRSNEKGSLVQEGFGLIVGVFTGTYSNAGAAALKAAYTELKRHTKYGKMSEPVYDLSQYIYRFRVDFPEMADRIVKMKNARYRFIPGIEVVTSDTGKSSFTLNAVVRIDGSEHTIITRSLKKSHKAKIDPAIFTGSSLQDLMNASLLFIERFREMDHVRVTGSPGTTATETYMSRLSLRNAAIRLLNGMQADDYIGKKRSKNIVKMIDAKYSNRTGPVFVSDVAAAILCMEPEADLNHSQREDYKMSLKNIVKYMEIAG